MTRGIQRSSPGWGHVCRTKPCLFPEALTVLTASPAVSSALGMFPQLLCTNTHTGYPVSQACLSTEVKEQAPAPCGGRGRALGGSATNRWGGGGGWDKDELPRLLSLHESARQAEFRLHRGVLTMIQSLQKRFCMTVPPSLFQWHLKFSVTSQRARIL